MTTRSKGSLTPASGGSHSGKKLHGFKIASQWTDARRRKVPIKQHCEEEEQAYLAELGYKLLFEVHGSSHGEALHLLSILNMFPLFWNYLKSGFK